MREESIAQRASRRAAEFQQQQAHTVKSHAVQIKEQAEQITQQKNKIQELGELLTELKNNQESLNQATEPLQTSNIFSTIQNFVIENPIISISIAISAAAIIFGSYYYFKYIKINPESELLPVAHAIPNDQNTINNINIEGHIDSIADAAVSILLNNERFLLSIHSEIIYEALIQHVGFSQQTSTAILTHMARMDQLINELSVIYMPVPPITDNVITVVANLL